MGQLAEGFRQGVAEGRYDGYVKNAAIKLKQKLPIGKWDLDDIIAYMRQFAIEAADMYDPAKSNGAKFTTFLYRHLYMRSLQWKNWDWLKKNHPEGKSVGLFSSYEHHFGLEGNFDPTRMKENPLFDMEMTDLFKMLTPQSRMTLSMLIGINSEELCEAFRSGHHSAVYALTGIIRPDFDRFVREVRNKAPLCIRSV